MPLLLEAREVQRKSLQPWKMQVFMLLDHQHSWVRLAGGNGTLKQARYVRCKRVNGCERFGSKKYLGLDISCKG